MFPIAYHTFETLEELLRFIGEEDDYRLLAGGTDLMVRYRAGKERAGKLVNLLIPELTGIRETPAELVVGASTSARQETSARWAAISVPAMPAPTWRRRCSRLTPG